MGLESIFVLTTRTMHWFLKRGFVQVDPTGCPRPQAQVQLGPQEPGAGQEAVLPCSLGKRPLPTHLRFTKLSGPGQGNRPPGESDELSLASFVDSNELFGPEACAPCRCAIFLLASRHPKN
jgi:hypothetical protein